MVHFLRLSMHANHSGPEDLPENHHPSIKFDLKFQNSVTTGCLIVGLEIEDTEEECTDGAACLEACPSF